MLCGGGGQHCRRYNYIFFDSLQFLSELNNIFHAKGLKLVTFNVKSIDGSRKTKQENIESLNLTQKVIF